MEKNSGPKGSRKGRMRGVYDLPGNSWLGKATEQQANDEIVMHRLDSSIHENLSNNFYTQKKKRKKQLKGECTDVNYP